MNEKTDDPTILSTKFTLNKSITPSKNNYRRKGRKSGFVEAASLKTCCRSRILVSYTCILKSRLLPATREEGDSMDKTRPSRDFFFFFYTQRDPDRIPDGGTKHSDYSTGPWTLIAVPMVRTLENIPQSHRECVEGILDAHGHVRENEARRIVSTLVRRLIVLRNQKTRLRVFIKFFIKFSIKFFH